MATPLTDSINALTTYANEVTGASDTTLSDAVHTLASGYGGGGTSSWTKVAETSYQVSTTVTGSSVHATFATGHSEIWTSEKIVYIRIRDTAGKRNGYFYGSDTFFMNKYPANGTTTTNATYDAITNIWYVSSTGTYEQRYGYGSTGYGVFASTVYRDGRIDIRKRYNSTYSLTIDGTYKVEVYLLDPAGGVPIFE